MSTTLIWTHVKLNMQHIGMYIFIVGIDAIEGEIECTTLCTCLIKFNRNVCCLEDSLGSMFV